MARRVEEKRPDPSENGGEAFGGVEERRLTGHLLPFSG
jgi:hypothetical protein